MPRHETIDFSVSVVRSIKSAAKVRVELARARRQNYGCLPSLGIMTERLKDPTAPEQAPY